MAEGSILDALDALKRLEENLKSRDAEFREREAALQEQGSKVEEDRRVPHQERTSLADERDSLVGRGERKRARQKELEQSERAIADPGQQFDAKRQQVLAPEKSLVARQ